jgi:cell division transport system permease protein
MNNESKKMQMSRLSFWIISHIRALFFGLGELVRHPFASFMTMLVIGIAIALPAGLYILLQNVQTIGKDFNGTPTISLYLKSDAGDPSALKNSLQKMPDIQKVDMVTPEEGLKEFEQQTKINNVAQLLQKNPLPTVLIITPEKSAETPEKLGSLANQLKTMPEVAEVQFDLTWVKRLYYILMTAQRLALVLGILFGAGVVLIIGNTIRLTTQNHREEINMLKLIGATSAFIRRPLLYRGFLYGFFGSAVALVIISIMTLWLKEPIYALARSYDMNLSLAGLSFDEIFFIMGLSSLLGLIGSWFAIQRHLFRRETA